MDLRAAVRRHETLFELDSAEERITFEPTRLRDIHPRSLAVRFAFGTRTRKWMWGVRPLYQPG